MYITLPVDFVERNRPPTGPSIYPDVPIFFHPTFYLSRTSQSCVKLANQIHENIKKMDVEANIGTTVSSRVWAG